MSSLGGVVSGGHPDCCLKKPGDNNNNNRGDADNNIGSQPPTARTLDASPELLLLKAPKLNSFRSPNPQTRMLLQSQRQDLHSTRDRCCHSLHKPHQLVTLS